ncbi:MAG: hypothetical protein JW844_00560 [Candidatus Omnitrophica bacterium]|nr:hypothetical protein [Candidatus Omnitrophota bacterium]
MHFLFIALNNDHLLDDVLSLMTGLEIVDATVMDGVRQERILAKDIPIFAGLLRSATGDRPYNKVIFATVHDVDTVKELVRLCKKQRIDFGDEETGKVVVLPVTYTT